ncbi:CMP-N-acetylneuraminate-poly-alpha-2,8-sialyltransferase-like [Antedon mediterranea]|uniref:CMP-N-acetylneuraminate-poly-alpha-2, 8-sialyltransferase-like n=1 Tax=Antedon mediterranea TaxID=105859 RepID=UPI003AF694C8
MNKILLRFVYGLGILSISVFYYTHDINLYIHYLRRSTLTNGSYRSSQGTHEKDQKTNYLTNSLTNDVYHPFQPKHYLLPFKERVYKLLKDHIDVRNAAELSVSLQKFSPNNTVLFYDKPVDYNNETKIVLPKKNPSRKKTIGSYDTCAILGNSGILIDSHCGKEIDAHDFVLRSNLAPTVGYTNDVGNKTNLTTLNSEKCNYIANCLKHDKLRCKDKVYKLMKSFDGTFVWFSKFGVVPSSNYVTFTQAIMDNKLKTEIAYPGFGLPTHISKYWKVDSPSSGLVLYTIASTFCRKISMYGFYPFYTKDDGTPVFHHYYDNKTTLNYTQNRHNMPNEFKLFLELNRTRHLRLVTDHCIQ